MRVWAASSRGKCLVRVRGPLVSVHSNLQCLQSPCVTNINNNTLTQRCSPLVTPDTEYIMNIFLLFYFLCHVSLISCQPFFSLGRNDHLIKKRLFRLNNSDPLRRLRIGVQRMTAGMRDLVSRWSLCHMRHWINCYKSYHYLYLFIFTGWSEEEDTIVLYISSTQWGHNLISTRHILQRSRTLMPTTREI